MLFMHISFMLKKLLYLQKVLSYYEDVFNIIFSDSGS